MVQTLQNVHSNRGARLSGKIFFVLFLILQLTSRIVASEALREVVNERGVAGLFAGLAPSLVLSVYPALQHSIFDRL